MDQEIGKRIEEVRAYLRESGESQSSLARAAGISGSTLSNVLAEKYAGSYEEVLSAVEDAIQRKTDKNRAVFRKPDFFETSVSRKGLRALNDVAGAAVPYILVLYGDSGIGKTEFLAEYLRRNPTAAMVEVRSDFSPRPLLKELSEKLGLPSGGAIYDVTNRIIAKIKGSGRVLIFDEAEYLDSRSLDIIRRIHDQSGVPVVLVGLPRLYHNLVALRKGFEQIANRMLSYSLGKPEREDFEKFVRACIPNVASEVCAAFVEASKETFRTLLLLTQSLMNYEHNTGKKLTAKAVKAYVATLH